MVHSRHFEPHRPTGSGFSGEASQLSGQLPAPEFAISEWQAVTVAVQRLLGAGVMSPSGHGNLSTRLQADGSRVLLQDLNSQDWAILRLGGDVVERGALSVETRQIVPMHTVVYEARPDVEAIIHTHSPYSTVFALAQRPLPCCYESLLHFGQVQDIPVAAWGPRGSQASVQGILKALGGQPGTQALLLANHGVLVFGRDLVGAANLLITIEEAAAAALRASALGGALPFPEDAFEQVRVQMASMAGT